MKFRTKLYISIATVLYIGSAYLLFVKDWWATKNDEIEAWLVYVFFYFHFNVITFQSCIFSNRRTSINSRKIRQNR